MKKNTLILLITVLLFSCSKDSTTSDSLTSKERALIGKWYNDTFESTFGSMDMTCATCYWEFFPAKGDNGVFEGKINDGAFFPWWTEQNGEIYIMLDVMVKVMSITDTQLTVGIEGMTWTFFREGFQPKDTDNDGVKDTLDKCPNTPNGDNVDENGCPISLKTYVPDDNFEKALIVLGYDDVLDNYVMTSSISGVESLSFYYGDLPDDKRIKDLTGIESFFALKRLMCNGQLLTSIDVSKNTRLEDLSCDYNILTSLDVSKNISLKYLTCGNNLITSLDVSKNTALIGLGCSNNQLTSLDLSKNPMLTGMSCWYNPLTCIKVNQTQLSNISSNWHKAPGVTYSLSCN